MDDTISSISVSQSQAERMEDGEIESELDKDTLNLLNHAKILQGKDQLEMAIEYFDEVLSKYPECVEAQVHRRISAKALDKREMKRQQEMVQAPVVTKMDVDWDWGGMEMYYGDDSCDNDGCAFQAIKCELNRMGYGKSSIVSLLQNSVVREDEYCIYGRASFQVTLIQDPPENNVATPDVPKPNAQEIEVSNQRGLKEQDAVTTTLSQFADAESSPNTDNRDPNVQ